MKKSIIVSIIVIIALVAGIGCFIFFRNKPEPLTYDWNPPLSNGVRWGDSEEEVFKKLKLDPDTAEKVEGEENVRYTFYDQTIYGELQADVLLSFDKQYESGLNNVVFGLEDKDLYKIAVKKTKEYCSKGEVLGYPNLPGTAILDLDSNTIEVYRNYIKTFTDDEARIQEAMRGSIVSVSFWSGDDSRHMNSIHFHGGKASMIENILKRENDK